MFPHPRHHPIRYQQEYVQLSCMCQLTHDILFGLDPSFPAKPEKPLAKVGGLLLVQMQAPLPL